MKMKSMRHVVVVAGASLLTGFCLPTPSRADSPPVDVGYDLFQTQSGTYFNFGSGNVPLMGVPLGTYNFGSGPQNVGNTDTIIQRLAPVTTAGDQTGLLMDALQLETVAPINLGSGPQDYYITLDPNHASTGTMTINAGTFTSSLDVFFDIHAGSLSGPIVNAGDLPLVNSGDTWLHTAPPGSVLIPGVDYDLNGVDTSADFFPATLTEAHPGVGAHVVDPAPIPDAASTWALLLMSAGLMTLLAGREKTARRA